MRRILILAALGLSMLAGCAQVGGLCRGQKPGQYYLLTRSPWTGSPCISEMQVQPDGTMKRVKNVW